MIEFREGQDKIFISKHKLCVSDTLNHLDLHLVYTEDPESGYDAKFVRVITFENIYEFDLLKNIRSSSFTDDIEGIKYFENGGYLFDKSKFN